MTPLIIIFSIYTYLFIGGKTHRYLANHGWDDLNKPGAWFGGVFWPLFVSGYLLKHLVLWPYELGVGKHKDTPELPEAKIYEKD